MNEKLMRGSNAIRNHVPQRQWPWWWRATAWALAATGLLLIVGAIKGALGR